MEYLKAPHNGLLILAAQRSLVWQLFVPLNCVPKQTVIIRENLLLFYDELEDMLEFLHGLVELATADQKLDGRLDVRTVALILVGFLQKNNA